MKTLNSRQWAAVKRIAQNVNPLLAKRLKLMSTIQIAQESLDSIVKEIEAQEAGVKMMTGFSVDDLVTKVVDENKKVSYVPNKKNVKFNDETKQYEVDVLAEASTQEDTAEPAVLEEAEAPVETQEEATSNEVVSDGPSFN